MSVLVVDVGNSRTKLALCDVANGLPECASFMALDNADADTLVARLSQFAKSGYQSAVVAGSDDRLRDAVVDAWPGNGSAPIVVRGWEQVPVQLAVSSPKTVGIDRLLNALGTKLLPEDGAFVIVDSGTATTVDLVHDGTFMGGAILPGLRMSAQSLHDYTAALPHIDTAHLAFDTTAVPGTDTQSAIAAGVLFGQIGAVREIVGRYRDQYPSATLILTGGAAQRLKPAFESASVYPYLSLRAMASLAAM